MSKIEWTNETWNPIIGCTKISEGCKNCYAEKMAYRLANMYSTSDTYGEVISYYKKEWFGNTYFVNSALRKPYKWKKPRMIFVCSMGDLFHETTPFERILGVWDIMCSNPRHTYQLLTKRPQRILEFLKWLGKKCKDDGFDSVPSSSDNYLDYITVPKFIWIGVTTENQEQANKRIPILLQIPAKVRFISCEPLLTDIDFPWYQGAQPNNGTVIKDLDWIIAGPETGPKSRPMQKEWIENIYKQCKAENVPFFDKRNSLGLNLNQFPNV